MTFKVGDKVRFRKVSVPFAGPLYRAFKDQVLTVAWVVKRHPYNYLILEEALAVWPDHAQAVEKFELAEDTVDAHVPGAKLDAGKPQPLLIERDMANALAAVVEVATFGAKKYSPGGWLQVADGFNRYSDAEARHRNKRHRGETHDDDSKLLHLQHEAWNALAKLELYLRENANKV
jgi:hypothetical protein